MSAKGRKRTLEPAPDRQHQRLRLSGVTRLLPRCAARLNPAGELLEGDALVE